MSKLKSAGLVVSMGAGALFTLSEFGVMMFGHEGENLQSLVQRKILEQASPHKVQVVLDPARATYALDDQVQLSVVLEDESGQRLPDERLQGYSVSYSADKPIVRIEEGHLLVKGTGRVLVKGCVVARGEPSGNLSEGAEGSDGLCGEVEMMVLDTSLPFE